MAQVVNPFAQAEPETTQSGHPVINPFSEPELDYTKLGEFTDNHIPGVTEGQKWRIALGYLTTPSEAARADILTTVLPGARTEKDPNTIQQLKAKLKALSN